MRKKTPTLILLDNQDSFTYIIYQYLLMLNTHTYIIPASEASLRPAEINMSGALVISPGPGSPSQSPASIAVLQHFPKHKPILGICLGHQIIGTYFGAKTIIAERIMHGKISKIHHNNTDIFAGLPLSFNVTRYHSLILDPTSLPPELEVTAVTKDKHHPPEIMAIAHKTRPVYGVQFHPEAIRTEYGIQLLDTFVQKILHTPTAPSD